MKSNINKIFSCISKDLFIVMGQFLIITLHIFKIDIFNKKLILEDSQIIYNIGNFMIALGIILIIFSLKDLGKSISPMPRPRNNSKLITDGIYSILRHPMYYSLIIISLGFFIKSFTLYNLILSILLIFIINIKIKIEEKYLIRKYLKYTSYKKDIKI
tara:strand:+ start:452 stop:925 length:474 start_codon:yes stop_codon:yes gene_type:complete